MSDITFPSAWGYDKFEGRCEEWLMEVAVQCLIYRDDLSFDSRPYRNDDEALFDRVMEELREEPNWLVSQQHDHFEFIYDGQEFTVGTEAYADYIFEMSAQSLLEEAYYELEQIRENHCCYLANYLTFDDEMFLRDARHDYDHLVCPYDERVDHISYCVWDEQAKAHYAGGTLCMWRND